MKTGEPTSQATRILIVSWHWPPANRASAGVLGALFGAAPHGAFRVVTRSPSRGLRNERCDGAADLDERVPVTRVPAPPDASDDRVHRRLTDAARQWLATWQTVGSMIVVAHRLGRSWGATRVLAVYPHRLGLVAGWWSARLLGVPLVTYMHDLLAECVLFRHRLRRLWWRWVDRACLKRSWMIVVPTREFAEHYRRRGLPRCWVLPHCMPGPAPVESRAAPDRMRRTSRALHLVYSGAVYEPHIAAVEAFITATRWLPDVRVTFLSDPRGCDGLLGRAGARWLPHAEAMRTLDDADVGVVLLAADSVCPEEVHGCFPSKIIDYVRAAKPILAVVPAGSFVDRLISESGCGVVVRRHDTASILAAIDRMRDPDARERMSRAAVALGRNLRAEDWMDRLLQCLQHGPAGAIATPASPRIQTLSPHAHASVGMPLGGELLVADRHRTVDSARDPLPALRHLPREATSRVMAIGGAQN